MEVVFRIIGPWSRIAGYYLAHSERTGILVVHLSSFGVDEKMAMPGNANEYSLSILLLPL